MGFVFCCFFCVFYTKLQFYSGVCVWFLFIDSFSMHNYVIILFKDEFSLSFPRIDSSKSTEKEDALCSIFTIVKFLLYFFVFFSVEIFKILRSKLFSCILSITFSCSILLFCLLWFFTLTFPLLNITRSHILIFVLFAVASNSSSTHRNQMLVPLFSIRNIVVVFFHSRCKVVKTKETVLID